MGTLVDLDAWESLVGELTAIGVDVGSPLTRADEHAEDLELRGYDAFTSPRA